MGIVVGICLDKPQYALSLVLTYSRHINMYIFLVVTTISSIKLLLYDMDVSCQRPFLPGTSLESAVIPTVLDSSFTLQYFPYYV